MKKVYIAYIGRFNKSIGPPTSMQRLAILLSEHYKVITTSNLRDLKLNPEEKEGQKKINKVRSGAPSSLKNLYKFFNILLANILLFIQIFYKKIDILIITQPYFFIFSNKVRCIYIKRANLDINDIGRDDKLHFFFEKSFIKRNFELVYLVEQDYSVSRPYHVIPNHFDDKEFRSKYSNHDYNINNINFIGTLNDRKGINDVINIAKKLKNYNFNFYGKCKKVSTLKAIEHLENANAYGQVSKPYNNLQIGEVYISLSKVEGLQRSMIEAMFMGCIVVAYSRPDSLSLSHLPGVFITKAGNDQELIKIFEYISSLTKSKREIYGLENKKFVQMEYSSYATLNKWNKLINNGL